MSGIRSRRLKMLEGMRRTLCDLLHDRVRAAARSRGCPRPPKSTSRIYALATKVAPGLLDQLFSIHLQASDERGKAEKPPTPHVPTAENERRRMLSAVRASITRAYG